MIRVFWKVDRLIVRLSGMMIVLLLSACGTATPASPTPVAIQNNSGQWHLPLRTTWNYQLANTPIDSSISAQVYDIDGFDRSAGDVASLHKKGIRVICYIDAGSWENWRPDAQNFPKSIIGKPLPDWPGEQWLDIRQISILMPILTARIQMCKEKGFDAIDADNVDGYKNATGFPLTGHDQLTFNVWLASTSHAHGMPIGLKNDIDQVHQLAPYFDFAVNEQCFQYQECDALSLFVAEGKPVFQVEYRSDMKNVCRQANSLGFNTIGKDISLNAPVIQCQ